MASPLRTRRIELESAYYGTGSLLEVYLGKNAARRVLAGAFRRGGGELIEAAVWFCDLRDFTRTSDAAAAEHVVDLGAHELKGVARAVRVFSLERYANVS